MALRGGPSHIGYLQLLYGSNTSDAALNADDLVFRATDLAAMNVAWQFFVNGVQYPFLEHKLHPFYGVYFTPTPIDHFLNLVGWLDEHPDLLAKPAARALDLGTGCGVVSFLLRAQRPGLDLVASDICPNAVFSTRCEVERWGARGIEVIQSDLFTNMEDGELFDAIVFNPPWMPQRDEASHEMAQSESGEGPCVSGVRRGNDYPPDLFDRLFAEAPKHLRPGGRLLVLFSDYAERRKLVQTSPLRSFAENGNTAALRLEHVYRKRVVPTDRGQHRMTKRDKGWALQQDYHAELWDFVKSLP